jgi:hypothetical protein
MTAREVIATTLVPIAPDPRAEAAAILAALREAGLVVVPVEPSEEVIWEMAEALLGPGMRVTCDTLRRVHRAMLAAAEKEARDA